LDKTLMHGRRNTAVGMDPILTQEQIIWTLAIDDEESSWDGLTFDR
jgi:hypothetical protein